MDVDSLLPTLFDRDLALSSLLPSLFDLADKAPICNGGNLPLPATLFPTCGMAWLPIGVARLSCGGPCGGIAKGGTACELMTGLALGEGGIARPNLGVLDPPAGLVPGIGGLNNGAGDAMSGCWRGGG